ncbi:CPBP family intramembrane glutamic endopeptidase [Oceanobacillus luteolus]|uniref:CPBP family intramembrane glutamic endopeptidase n=1 Tax=Oceanobacillus luteolus TaxID=1274358 RepID=A0ABW4HT51_9BACI
MELFKYFISGLLLIFFIYFNLYEIIISEVIIICSLLLLPKLIGKINDLIRSLLFFLPYILPIFVFRVDIFEGYSNHLLIFIFGLMFVVLLHFFNISEYRIMFDPALIDFMKPINLNNFLFRLLESYGSAITEEIFYRGFVLFILISYINPIYAILITSLLFISNHLYNRHAEDRFTYKNLFMIFCLSCVLSGVFYYTQNIFYCIVLHLIYNTPQIVYNFILYKKGELK